MYLAGSTENRRLPQNHASQNPKGNVQWQAGLSTFSGLTSFIPSGFIVHLTPDTQSVGHSTSQSVSKQLSKSWRKPVLTSDGRYQRGVYPLPTDCPPLPPTPSSGGSWRTWRRARTSRRASRPGTRSQSRILPAGNPHGTHTPPSSQSHRQPTTRPPTHGFIRNHTRKPSHPKPILSYDLARLDCSTSGWRLRRGGHHPALRLHLPGQARPGSCLGGSDLTSPLEVVGGGGELPGVRVRPKLSGDNFPGWGQVGKERRGREGIGFFCCCRGYHATQRGVVIFFGHWR